MDPRRVQELMQRGLRDLMMMKVFCFQFYLFRLSDWSGVEWSGVGWSGEVFF